MEDKQFRKYLITLTFRAYEDGNEFYTKVGRTKFKVTAHDQIDAINHAISFAYNIPSWVLEENDIDLKNTRTEIDTIERVFILGKEKTNA